MFNGIKGCLTSCCPNKRMYFFAREVIGDTIELSMEINFLQELANPIMCLICIKLDGGVNLELPGLFVLMGTFLYQMSNVQGILCVT